MKVLLFELNEITWRLLDPLIARGALPAFSFLKECGAYGSTESVDLGDDLDPWITWTTVYTGKPQEEHGVLFLEQPAETIKARRIWELAAEAGLSVGVYGSLNSWPPHPVKGFWVPGTFAQDPSTYPANLRAIQEINLLYTRGYNYGSSHGNDGLLWKAFMGMRLAMLGLRARTAFETLAHLAQERRRREIAWKRVSLQPLINFDIFARLYRAYRPALSTFHTNHVAHYQHLYWRAAQPEHFSDKPSPEERETYNGAIEHGYRIADRVLGQMLDLIDSDTVLLVASSMGQQPYKNPKLVKGKRLLRIRSFDAIIDLLELEGQIRVVPTMADQFNVYAVTQEVLDRVEKTLRDAYIDRTDQPMFGMQRSGNALTLCVAQFNDLGDDSVCHFHVNGRWKTVRYVELVEMFGHTKSGCHHPSGVIMAYGRGVRPGPLSREISTLDLAPTVLQLLGLPKNDGMKGIVIQEVVEDKPPLTCMKPIEQNAVMR